MNVCAPKIVAYGDQLFEFVGEADHIRRDGGKVRLKRWRTRCAECGAPFEFRSTKETIFEPSRRCGEHKAPGRPVAGRRGSKRTRPAKPEEVRQLIEARREIARAIRLLRQGRPEDARRVLQASKTGGDND